MVDFATPEQGEGVRMRLRPDPVVRPAAEPELDAVAALFAPGLAPYRGTDADPLLDSYLAELRDVRSRFDVAEVYVALHEAQLVGSVSFYRDVRLEGWSSFPGGWAGFRALVVHPDARGTGVGKALLQTCIARTRTIGAPVLGLHTIELLADAVRLYERLGFVRCQEYDLRAADVFPGAYTGAMVGLAYRFEV
jgi:GNAT superfamily N-acetyltransferase